MEDSRCNRNEHSVMHGLVRSSVVIVPLCPASDGGLLEQPHKPRIKCCANVGILNMRRCLSNHRAFHMDALTCRRGFLIHAHLTQPAYCETVTIGTLSSGLLDSTGSRRSSCLARQHPRMMSTSRFGMSSDLLASRRQAMATICIAQPVTRTLPVAYPMVAAQKHVV